MPHILQQLMLPVLLVLVGAQAETDLGQELYYAARVGDLDQVKTLIAKGADVDKWSDAQKWQVTEIPACLYQQHLRARGSPHGYAHVHAAMQRPGRTRSTGRHRC